jgi:hypothetical protein
MSAEWLPAVHDVSPSLLLIRRPLIRCPWSRCPKWLPVEDGIYFDVDVMTKKKEPKKKKALNYFNTSQ